MIRRRIRLTGWSVITCILIGLAIVSAPAQSQEQKQTKSYERSFPQSKAEIEKALKELQPALAGRLPSLEGFATPGDHSLENYGRGFYQAQVKVDTTAAGSVVRIKTTVTAWYNDSSAAHTGYRKLTSNGRIEGDILDQLADVLAKTADAGVTSASTAKAEPSTQEKLVMAPAEAKAQEFSAPMPQLPATGTFSSSVSEGLAARKDDASAADKASRDKDSALRTEAANLEEILKNQSHPKNLVAVKKSGTAVVASPSLNAKTLFLASTHDEFEMLDFNQDWVHVKISGLSRGWIWRNSLEMPDGIPDMAQSGPNPAAELFHVTREDISTFPGDWTPLRGKNVRILSVQKTGEGENGVSPEMKLEFAKSLFEKNYAGVAQKPQELAGIVLIFDSADGGMIAAPFTVLQQWKAGALSDAAMWRQCFFDPPEPVESSSAGTQ